MQIYKNITVSKLKEQSGDPKKPTHSIVVSDSNYENKKNVGKMWTKEGQFGKFLSGVLDTERQTEHGFYDGFVILTEKDYKTLLEGKKDKIEDTPSSTNNTGEANPDDLDF